MQIFTNPNFNFIRWRWHAIALSLVVILAGAASSGPRAACRMGIDFKGGTIIILKFDQPVHEDAVRKALDRMPGEKVVQQYGTAEANEILVRLPQTVEREEGALLERDVNAAEAAIQQANLAKFEIVGTEVVGPVIGAQLQRKGLYARCSRSSASPPTSPSGSGSASRSGPSPRRSTTSS